MEHVHIANDPGIIEKSIFPLPKSTPFGEDFSGLPAFGPQNLMMDTGEINSDPFGFHELSGTCRIWKPCCLVLPAPPPWLQVGVRCAVKILKGSQVVF